MHRYCQMFQHPIKAPDSPSNHFNIQEGPKNHSNLQETHSKMKFNLAQGIYGRFRNAKEQEEGHQHDAKGEDKMNDHGVVAGDTTKVSNDMMQDQMKKSPVDDSDHHLDKGMENEGGGLKDLDDSHQDKPPKKKWMNRYGTEQDMILD